MDKKIYIFVNYVLLFPTFMIVLKNGNNGDLAYNETFFMPFTQPTNVCIANRKVRIPCPAKNIFVDITVKNLKKSTKLNKNVQNCRNRGARGWAMPPPPPPDKFGSIN